MNIFCLLEQASQCFGDRGAVYFGQDQVQSFAALRARSLRLAASLRERFPAGSRIAIVSENCVEYVELMFGIWAAQCVAVPINYKLHAKEIFQILSDAGAALVFASPKLIEGLVADSVVTIGSTDYEACFSAAEEVGGLFATDPDTLAWLFYTSGTTGRSKGAMLTHRNLMAMTTAHLADVESIDEYASQIQAAPMSHGSGFYILAYLSRGARQVIPKSQGFVPSEFLELASFHPSCGAFLAPTMVQRLRLECEASGVSPTNLRSVVYGGGPMYVEEMKKALRVFGPVFVQIYGQGEAPMTITSLRTQDHALGDDSILGSVGWPRTGVQVAVLNSDGRIAEVGEMGEIICRGDVVMQGYWGNPTATADALQSGWLHTGDMGSFDSRGYLTLRDRSKDVVISGGSNIYPREVEEALLTHPEVLEVSVVGQPDEEWGEVVIAFVVRTLGSNLQVAQLDQHCLETIARFKRPKHYIFLDALPKNSYGKVLKRELRQINVKNRISK